MKKGELTILMKEYAKIEGSHINDIKKEFYKAEPKQRRNLIRFWEKIIESRGCEESGERLEK